MPAAVFLVGLKGVDKLGKAGKVGNVTSKTDTTLPYNAMKTDKLTETVKANVYANVQQKTAQALNFWQSNFSKEAINKTIEAEKHSAVMTKAKNTLNSVNIKETATKTYQDVVKTLIAKTQAAWEKKKDQLLDMPLPNLGLAPVPLGPTANRTVREGIEAAQNTVMRIVGNKGVGGELAEGTGNVHRYEIDEVIKNDYDKNGKWINRSIVPKGYESVEDFLKVVDDTTIKEFGYDSVEEFKSVVGHVDDYLNASPKNNITISIGGRSTACMRPIG